jgi:hypothetical protein
MDTSKFKPEKLARKQKRSVARRVKVAVVFILLASFVWTIFFPHETTTSQPVSLDQAEGCPIPLPPTARNIQFYKWWQFNFFREFVRFEAPVADCIKHIASVRVAWGNEFDYLRNDFEPVHNLEKPPMPSCLAHERGVTWFDPQNIRKGLTAGGGGSGIPTIWVDTERGVFYYELSD